MTYLFVIWILFVSPQPVVPNPIEDTILDDYRTICMEHECEWIEEKAQSL